jgi:hypothetical protein
MVHSVGLIGELYRTWCIVEHWDTDCHFCSQLHHMWWHTSSLLASSQPEGKQGKGTQRCAIG